MNSKDSHFQDENLIFGSLANFPPILFHKLFTCEHFHCGFVLGSEYLTELLPKKQKINFYFQFSYNHTSWD